MYGSLRFKGIVWDHGSTALAVTYIGYGFKNPTNLGFSALYFRQKPATLNKRFLTNTVMSTLPSRRKKVARNDVFENLTDDKEERMQERKEKEQREREAKERIEQLRKELHEGKGTGKMVHGKNKFDLC